MFISVAIYWVYTMCQIKVNNIMSLISKVTIPQIITSQGDVTVGAFILLAKTYG